MTRAGCLLFAAALGLTGVAQAAGPGRLFTQGQKPYVDAEHGFEITPPEGWIPTPTPQPDGTHTTYFLPPGSRGQVLLGVSLRELEPGQGAQHLLGLSLAKVAADSAFSDLEQFEASLDGVPGPALRVRYASPTGPLTLEVGYHAVGARGYVLQRAAPPGEFSAWADAFAAASASFRTLEPREVSAGDALLAELAARCGSQVELAATWEAAARRAREQQCNVLVVAWAYGGFKLPYSPRTTILCDPELVALLEGDFVVWMLDKSASNDFSAHDGLSPTTFGQGLILATPEGRVLAQLEEATDSDLAREFLERSLGRNGAELRLAELGDADSAPAELQRAHALRLLRRGDEALAALERATAADGTGELTADILAERAWVELRSGRGDAARATAADLLGRAPGSEQAANARLLLGLLELSQGAADAAGAHWMALCEQHPESPLAWQVAAWMQAGLLDMDLAGELDLAWPAEAEQAQRLAQADYTPLPTGDAELARDQALAWLLEHQRGDGTWSARTDRGERHEGRPDPFVDAVTSLAARALLPHRADARVAAALERAYTFLLGSLEARARYPERVLYMDYTPWSDAALLDAFAGGLQTGVGDADALRRGILQLVADLQARRQPHGGWGYYVTGDLQGAAAPPSAMSFTTAAVLLALAHARQAGGSVSAEVVLAAAETLETLRAPGGQFVYMQGPNGRASVSDREAPGAAGRAAVCELALLHGGRSTPARLEAALQLFLADAPSLAAERGKVLMHSGAAGQGCHYVLFDYAWTALAASELPRDPELAARLTELVLDCRLADGSFLDTPINGRAYGTAQALLALDVLLP